MAGWHHQLDGHEFEWTLGVGYGRGGLACCNSWSRKESDTSEWLNWIELILHHRASRVAIVVKKTLESPLDCKEIQPVNPKGNESWMFTGRTDAEAETQYSGHLIRRTDSLEKTLMLGKIEGRRRSRWQGRRWSDSIINSMDVSLSRLWEIVKPGVLQFMGRQRVLAMEQ